VSGVIDTILGLPPGLVLALVFLLPAVEASLFVGVIVPGEIAVLLGGVLANEGRLSLWAVIGVAALGAIIGDSIGYEVGRRFGQRLLDRLPRRLVKPEHVQRAKALIDRRRGWSIFLGRFTAALRALMPGMAGLARLPYRSFLLWNVLGGTAWATETTLVGYLAGRGYRAAEHRLSLIGFGLLALIIGGYALVRLREQPRVRGWLDRRLSTDRWTGRPLTLLALAVTASGWLFAGVLQDVLSGDGVATADPHLHATALALRRGWLTTLADGITQLGAGAVVYPLTLTAVLVAVVGYRRWAEAALVAVALLSGQSLRALTNRLVDRPRPPHADWLINASGRAWPSGHTATAVLAYGLLVALFWPILTRAVIRVAAVAAATLIALAVGLSRVYLGVHWPSDVLGGWAFGALWLTIAVTAISALRFHTRPPRSTSGARAGWRYPARSIQVDVDQQGNEGTQQAHEHHPVGRLSAQRTETHYQDQRSQGEDPGSGVLPTDGQHQDRHVDEELVGARGPQDRIPGDGSTGSTEEDRSQHDTVAMPDKHGDRNSSRNAAQRSTVEDGSP